MPVGSPRPDTRTGYPDWTRDEKSVDDYITYAGAEDEPVQRKCRMSPFGVYVIGSFVLIVGLIILGAVEGWI